MGDYAAKELKYKRVATISDDFAFGYEQMGGFQRVFEDNGGKVVKKLWPPLVTPDYTPYIAQIGNVDCVFNGFAGSNPVQVHARLRRPRPQGQDPAAGRLDRRWTTRCCKSLGDEAVGVLSARLLLGRRSTRRATSASSPAMQKDYNVLPGGYSAGMYIAGQCVEAAHPDARRQGRRPQGARRGAAQGRR